MKIAIVHFTAPPVTGGAENIIREHARLMSSAGHTVTVVAGRGSAPRDGAWEFRRLPLMAATHPTQRKVADQLAQGTAPRGFELVRATLGRELGPVLAGQDVVIAHNVMTLHFNLPLTAALNDLVLGEKIAGPVAWTHDISAVNPLYTSELHSGFPWDLLRRPWPRSTYVCVSHERRRELLDVWKRSGDPPTAAVVVIHNGVDPVKVLGLGRAVRSLASRFGLLDRELLLLLPVRITRRKNIELAIETVAALRDRRVDVALVLTGPIRGHHPARSKQYLQELINRCRELAVQDRVIFAANELSRPLTDSELSDLYRLADVLFFPSASEGFGLPLLEAGLAKMPIVAAGIPVFEEIAGGRAVLFDPGSAAEIVARRVDELRRENGVIAQASHVRLAYAWNGIYERDIAPLLKVTARQALD